MLKWAGILMLVILVIGASGALASEPGAGVVATMPIASGGLGLVAIFFVQALKGAIPAQYHKWIPLALGVIMPLVGMGLAIATGNDPITGLTEGFAGAWFAVYGYEVAKGLKRG